MSQRSQINSNDKSESISDLSFLTKDIAEQLTNTNRLIEEANQEILSIEIERDSSARSEEGFSSLSSENKFELYQVNRKLFENSESSHLSVCDTVYKESVEYRSKSLKKTIKYYQIIKE